jgi:hypothetical protein
VRRRLPPTGSMLGWCGSQWWRWSSAHLHTSSIWREGWRRPRKEKEATITRSIRPPHRPVAEKTTTGWRRPITEKIVVESERGVGGWRPAARVGGDWRQLLGNWVKTFHPRIFGDFCDTPWWPRQPNQTRWLWSNLGQPGSSPRKPSQQSLMTP